MAICKTCGLPEEVCPHSQQFGGGEPVTIKQEPRRYGKLVTVVSGVPADQIDAIGTELKKKCAAGGTIKDGKIEIQGEHMKKVKVYLAEKGFKVA